MANKMNRFWNFNEAKSTAIIETPVQQMCDARWKLEFESRKRALPAETPCGENTDLPTNAKHFGRAQISNHFATVSPYQTFIANQKVFMVYNKWETIARRIEIPAVDEFDR
jgi:hypothetical protein